MLRLWHLAKFWQRERILKKCRKLKKLDFLNKAPKCDSAMRCYPQNPALLRLKKSGVAFALLGYGSLLPSLLSAASSTTPPVGYVKTTLLANSDTFIGASLTRPPAYVGTVLGAAGSGITVSGEPQWEIGAFTYVAGVQPNTYYVRLGAAPEGETNPFEGRTFTVEVGGASDLIVTDPLNGDLSTVPAGTKIEVIPYWTLNTLFPPEDAGVTFEESPSALITQRKTQVLFSDKTGVGINIPKNKIYFFFNGNWRKSGSSSLLSFDDVIIEPQTPIMVRDTSAGATDKDFLLHGNVLLGKLVSFVKSQASEPQDNYLNVPFPIPRTLGTLGLIDSGVFQVSPSSLLSQRKDLLLIYSNTTVVTPKPYADAYYYANGAWRKVGGSASLDFDDQEIDSDVQIILRKTADGVGGYLLWTFETL